MRPNHPKRGSARSNANKWLAQTSGFRGLRRSLQRLWLCLEVQFHHIEMNKEFLGEIADTKPQVSAPAGLPSRKRGTSVFSLLGEDAQESLGSRPLDLFAFVNAPRPAWGSSGRIRWWRESGGRRCLREISSPPPPFSQLPGAGDARSRC